MELLHRFILASEGSQIQQGISEESCFRKLNILTYIKSWKLFQTVSSCFWFQQNPEGYFGFYNPKNCTKFWFPKTCTHLQHDHLGRPRKQQLTKNGKMVMEVKAKCFNASLAVQKYDRCPTCTEHHSIAVVEQVYIKMQYPSAILKNVNFWFI